MSAVIKGARDILADPKHWTKCGFCDGRGAFCVRGALAKAAGRPLNETPLDEWDALTCHLPKHFAEISGSDPLSEFNDHPDTTHQDILDLLDKTLADLGVL